MWPLAPSEEAAEPRAVSSVLAVLPVGFQCPDSITNTHSLSGYITKSRLCMCVCTVAPICEF